MPGTPLCECAEEVFGRGQKPLPEEWFYSFITCDLKVSLVWTDDGVLDNENFWKFIFWVASRVNANSLAIRLVFFSEVGLIHFHPGKSFKELLNWPAGKLFSLLNYCHSCFSLNSTNLIKCDTNTWGLEFYVIERFCLLGTSIATYKWGCVSCGRAWWLRQKWYVRVTLLCQPPCLPVRFHMGNDHPCRIPQI